LANVRRDKVVPGVNPYTVIYDVGDGKQNVLGFHEWELEALNDD
jgi:hypothetical protein